MTHRDSFPFVNRLWKPQNVAAAFNHKGDLKQHLLNSNFMVLAGAAVSVVPMVLQGHHKDLPAQQQADRLPAFLSLSCPAEDWVSLTLAVTVTDVSGAHPRVALHGALFPTFLLHSKQLEKAVFFDSKQWLETNGSCARH